MQDYQTMNSLGEWATGIGLNFEKYSHYVISRLVSLITMHI